MFLRCARKDNKENVMTIQGSRSGEPGLDVASIIFENYDQDSDKRYNMAKISMQNAYDGVLDGYGDLVFKTNSGPEQTDATEWMRIKSTGSVGIGGLIDASGALDVSGDIIVRGAIRLQNTFGQESILDKATLDGLGGGGGGTDVSGSLGSLTNVSFAAGVQAGSLLYTPDAGTSWRATDKVFIDQGVKLGTVSPEAIVTPDSSANAIIYYTSTGTATITEEQTEGTATELRCAYIDASGALMQSVLNPLRSRGDMMVHDGTLERRLPLGAPNQVLFTTADPSNNFGIGWRYLSNDDASPSDDAPKYLSVTNSDIKPLTNTYEDVVFDTASRADATAFKIVGQNITILQTNTYLISATVAVESPENGRNANQFSAKLMVDVSGSGYVDIPGTEVSKYLYDRDLLSGTTLSIFLALSLSEGDRIKLQVVQEAGVTPLEIKASGAQLSVHRFTFDESNDASTVSSVFTTVGADVPAVGGVATPVVWTNDHVMDSSNYVFTPGGTTLGVVTAGRYLVTCTGGMTSATDDTTVRFRVLLNGVPVTGGEFYSSSKLLGGLATGAGSGSTAQVLDLGVSDTLSMDVLTTEGGGATLTGVTITAAKFASGVTQQEGITYFHGNASNDSTLTTFYTEVPLTATVMDASGIVHVPSTASVTLVEKGLYYIWATTTLSNDPGGRTTRESVVNARVVFDIGSGFSSLGFSPLFTITTLHEDIAASYVSATGNILVELPAGSRIQLEVSQIAGEETAQLIAAGTNMLAIRIEDINISTDVLQKFGSFYKTASSNTTISSLSDAFEEKLRMLTPYVPSGLYRIGLTCNLAETSFAKRVEIRAQVDDTLTVFTHSEYNSNALNSVMVTGFANVRLTEGFHTVDVDFRSLTVGREVVVGTTTIEFWRVA